MRQINAHTVSVCGILQNYLSPLPSFRLICRCITRVSYCHSSLSPSSPHMRPPFAHLLVVHRTFTFLLDISFAYVHFTTLALLTQNITPIALTFDTFSAYLPRSLCAFVSSAASPIFHAIVAHVSKIDCIVVACAFLVFPASLASLWTASLPPVSPALAQKPVVAAMFQTSATSSLFATDSQPRG